MLFPDPLLQKENQQKNRKINKENQTKNQTKPNKTKHFETGACSVAETVRKPEPRLPWSPSYWDCRHVPMPDTTVLKF